MFSRPADRQNLARQPVGLLASSPELMNAVVAQQGPLVTPDMFGVNKLQVRGQANLLGQGVNTPRGDRGLGPNIVEMPELVGGSQPQAVNVGTDTNVGADVESSAFEDDTKKAAPAKKAVSGADGPDPSELKPKQKPSAKKESDAFMDALARLKGTGPTKSKKERLAAAKEFLKEAGVDDVDDIRTDKDFLMMTLGAKLMGGRSEDLLTNLGDATEETLAMFGEGVKAEKAGERSLGIAAAEMASSEDAAARARADKFDTTQLNYLTQVAVQKIKSAEPTEKIRTAEYIRQDLRDAGVPEDQIPTVKSLVEKAQRVTDKQRLTEDLRSGDPDKIYTAITVIAPKVISDVAKGIYTKQDIVALYTSGTPLADPDAAAALGQAIQQGNPGLADDTLPQDDGFGRITTN